EESAKVALRTQQIIAYESGVTAAADPFGGSYYVEDLTDRLESEAREYIARIDAMGGALAGIEAGFQQGQIQNAAYEFQREVEAGKRVIVAVNRFQAEGEGGEVPVFRVDPAIEREQVARVAEVRARRDSAAWQGSLDALESAARSSENLMPRIVAAAEASATVGEISDTLRRVFGEYRDRG
ncbi:MAG TPA: methylmalonyl-CoA mutase family protein, partial [Bryobacteraceae bacterium]|nr:methylmalonyl-CoA mutase family protein [Bryobacteraceae bacterium]